MRLVNNTGGADTTQAAVMAQRPAAADLLSQTDKKGMVFAKQFGVSGQIVHKKVLIGGIAATLRFKTEAVYNATSVSINNENRFTHGIKYYRIGRLLTNAVD